MSTFATRVKEERIKKGLSQPQMAEDIGLTKQTISLWERGVRRPDFETMNKVADYFGVNVAYMIGQSDDPSLKKNPYLHSVANS
jgi:transcriptional regulator with XRE-family HTH domain